MKTFLSVLFSLALPVFALDHVVTEPTMPGAGMTVVSSTAYEASHVLKSSGGTLVSLLVYNSKASTQFIQLHNTASVPANTAVPIAVFEIPAASARSFDIPLTGFPFGTGISVCNSSTGPTKTVGSADCFFTAVVK